MVSMSDCCIKSLSVVSVVNVTATADEESFYHTSCNVAAMYTNCIFHIGIYMRDIYYTTIIVTYSDISLGFQANDISMGISPVGYNLT